MNVSFLGNVYVNGQPVCDDQWDLLDAQVAIDAWSNSLKYMSYTIHPYQVVCTQLGLGPAVAATTKGFFGPAEGEYLLDNVECSGAEGSIMDCEVLSAPNCDSTEAAGVICSSECTQAFNQLFMFYY